MTARRWTDRRLRAAGATRAGIGATLLLRPAALPRALGVDSATAAKIRWLGVMLGVRDAALGAGLVDAVRRRQDPRAWLLAAAVCDAVDALAMSGAAVRGDARPASAGVVAVFAAAGAASHLGAYRSITR